MLQVSPFAVVVQFGEEVVRFATTGVPPLIAIAADFVAAEMNAGRAASDWVAGAGGMVITRCRAPAVDACVLDGKS